MIKSVIKLITISFLAALFSCNQAFAGLTLGTSAIYANINDPNYDFVKEHEIAAKSLTIGYSKSFSNNISLAIQTNRLYNPASTRSVISKSTGATLRNTSKLTTDNFLVGYRFGRFIPAFVVSNVKLDKSLYYKGAFQGSQTNHAIVYGLNLGYMLTRHLNTSFIYIAPNKELYLESAFGIGINYLF